jgi:hypothetical protein
MGRWDRNRTGALRLWGTRRGAQDRLKLSGTALNSRFLATRRPATSNRSVVSLVVGLTAIERRRRASHERECCDFAWIPQSNQSFYLCLDAISGSRSGRSQQQLPPAPTEGAVGAGGMVTHGISALMTKRQGRMPLLPCGREGVQRSCRSRALIGAKRACAITGDAEEGSRAR